MAVLAGISSIPRRGFCSTSIGLSATDLGWLNVEWAEGFIWLDVNLNISQCQNGNERKSMSFPLSKNTAVKRHGM